MPASMSLERALGFVGGPPQVFAGANFTGSPLHWHGDAWNCVVHGAKSWLLLPPEAAVYACSTEPVSRWASEPAPCWRVGSCVVVYA